MATDIYNAVHAIGIPLIFGFAFYAIYLAFQEKRKKGKEIQNLAYFVAAKNTQSTARITFSLVSTALGTWVLITCPSFASGYGYLGMIGMAFGPAIVILIPAFLGPILLKYNSNCLSFSDYCEMRYGLIGKYFVAAIMVINMFLTLVAELTVLGQVFETIGGGNRIFIITLVCILTSIYTAIGGLSVSIRTDQVQGILSICLVILFSIYFASTFKMDTSLPLPDYLGDNAVNGGTISAVFFIMVGYTICSEYFWQKAWASKTEKNLKKSSVFAGLIVFVVLFLFGLFGFLEAWNGYFGVTYNLQLFSIFPDGHPSWILIILVITCMLLSESAIDSYQMGLASSISTCFLKKAPLWVSKIVVLLINIPAIIVSLENHNMNGVNLIIGLLCICLCPSIFLGLIPSLEKYHTFVNLIISYLIAHLFIAYWGCSQVPGWDVNDGLTYVYYVYYGAEPSAIGFGAAMISSLVISFLHFAIAKIFLQKKNRIEIENKSNKIIFLYF